VSDFLLHVALPLGLALSLLALLHVLLTRQGTAWFLIVVLLGPFGGLFYLASRLKWIKLEPKRAPDATSATATRRCPRCQQLVGSLHGFEDGRVTLLLCSMCKSEMELRRADLTVPDF
jgi:hypothetical protein